MGIEEKMAKKPKFKAQQTARKTVPILGVAVDSSEAREVLNRAWNLVLRGSEAGARLGKTPGLIVTPNPEIVSRAQADRKLIQILNKASLALPDGVGLVAAAWFLGKGKLNRVPGRLLAEDLIQRCAQHNKKAFLLGGKPGVARLAGRNLIKNCKMKIENLAYASGPWLNNNGVPVDASQLRLEKETIRKINDFGPDLLLVGFGAPKQEKWLSRNLPKLKIGAAMVVGGMIDYTARILPPPPRAFSKAGFEWLWRLIFEPRRFGRILTATIVFPWQVFLYKLKNKNP